MNKVVVVYKSKYGSTKQYAEWIAEETQGDLFEASAIKGDMLVKYDTIIYGGGMYAVGILGFKMIRSNYQQLKDKKIIVFSVGLSKESPEAIHHIKENNFSEEMRENVEFYMLRGAMNFEKLSFTDKMMMKALKKKIQKKDPEALSEEEQGILDCCDNPVSMMDRETIQTIVKATRFI